MAPAAVDEIEVAEENLAEENLAEENLAEENVVVEAAGEVPGLETPEPRAAQVRVPAPVPSAAELLAQANAARRDGDREGAARLYRRLQGLHPRSREAAISHVTLGRLLLDGMNDPQSSLREFDTYLGQTRHRVLEEEARVGRAMALSRLGRRDEERRAWRELLEHHPDTLYAERARARL
ncbi:MAG: tetratricopeptide repeat protein [Sandaracinaceae bacterium]|nr:tetratricopeptide repeat protein [Sandaracinaceae bacterium]